MPSDLSKFLRNLTVSDMKSVAEKHGIDVSSCKGKRSYITALEDADLTQKQVQDALGASAGKRKEAARENEEIERDLKQISERTLNTDDIPANENAAIERSIDKALMLRPLFFEVDAATELAWDRMILGDFSEAVLLNRESRSQVIDRLSTFHLYSTALSIRACETLLRQMEGLDSKAGSEIKTALAEAKMAFMNGPPKRRETTLEELEDLTGKALEAFIGKSEKAEEELRKMLEEYATFGVHVNSAHELLEIAVQAKNSHDVEQYAGFIIQAQEHADRAKQAKMKEFENTFEHVRMAIEAAKEAGVDTTDGEAKFKDAKKAFKKSDFVHAMQLLAGIEQAVDSAHLQKVRQSKETEAKEIAQITTSINEAEPSLEEAAAYGMDVQEGLLFVRSTKTALQQRDVVTAAKYSRRVRKLSKSMEKDLEKLRKKHGAAGKRSTSEASTEEEGGLKKVAVDPSAEKPRQRKEKKWRGILKK